MKNVLFILSMLCTITINVNAQGKYYSKTASMSFHAGTSMEDIDAQTNTGTVVMDAQTGKLESNVLIKAFQFKRALMQEHFNENYMESSKYPKATFKGTIKNLSDVNFSKDGTYKVKVEGTMDIHGVQKPLTTDGTVTVAGKNVKVNTNFILITADYGIKIPGVVSDKIAKEVKVTVNSELQPLVKK